MYKEVLEKERSQRKAAKFLNLSRNQFNYKLKEELGICARGTCKKIREEGKTRCRNHLDLANINRNDFPKKFKYIDFSKFYNLENYSFQEIIKICGSLKIAACVLNITKYSLKRSVQKEKGLCTYYECKNTPKLNDLQCEYHFNKEKKWSKNNHEKIRKYCKKWEKSARGISYSQQKREKIRYDFLSQSQVSMLRSTMPICQRCGTKKNLTFDHHIPIKLGGKFEFGNIIRLCRSCNSSKTDKLPKDFYTEEQLLKIESVLTSQKTLKYDANTCFQKLQRDKYLEEDIKAGYPLNPPIQDFIFAVEPFSKEHKQFIERYEWLGNVGFMHKWTFTARYQDKLGGVIFIGNPTNSGFDVKKEALIQRGACASWTPKNLGSKLIMFACNWMRKNTEKSIFVAYSDPTAGEIGTVYQACNFIYLGQKWGATELYRINSSKLVSARYFSRTSAHKKYAKILNIPWSKDWEAPSGFQDVHKIPKDILKLFRDYGKSEKNKCTKEKIPPKHKYVLFLDKKLEKQFNLQKLPYPKRNPIIESSSETNP